MRGKTNLNIEDTLKLIETNEEFADHLADSIQESIEEHNTHEASIESVTEFSEKEKTLLKEKLEKLLNKELALTFKVDTHVLGGFRVRVGDWKLDATLSTRLEQMKKLVGDSL